RHAPRTPRSRSGKSAWHQPVELRPSAPCPRRRIGSRNASRRGGRLTRLHSAYDKVILGRRFEHHPFRRFSRGCIEFAVLVRSLHTAPDREVSRCLNLIDGLVAASLLAPGEGPIDCSKCLAKMVLFA